MRWIYISPHLDDAVLSCGGLIHDQARQGTPVEIWTVICGYPPPGELSPFAQVLHFQWGTGTAEETVSLRRGEDRDAAAILGAVTSHLDTPDCIYRRGAEGEPLYPMDVFVSRHPFEAELDQQIARLLEAKLRPDDTLVCPLTIGGHVDHVLTRAAVEWLGLPIRYYADIPYLLNTPEALEPATSELHADLFPVSEAGLQAWQDGIAAYKSQILMLFETEEKMRAAIRSYWVEKGGLRLWQAAGRELA